jgi:hypothetical protein
MATEQLFIQPAEAFEVQAAETDHTFQDILAANNMTAEFQEASEEDAFAHLVQETANNAAEIEPNASSMAKTGLETDNPNGRRAIR